MWESRFTRGGNFYYQKYSQLLMRGAIFGTKKYMYLTKRKPNEGARGGWLIPGWVLGGVLQLTHFEPLGAFSTRKEQYHELRKELRGNEGVVQEADYRGVADPVGAVCHEDPEAQGPHTQRGQAQLLREVRKGLSRCDEEAGKSSTVAVTQ
jgi:hypothetical protein